MTYLELCQETLESSDTGSPQALSSLQDASQYQSQVVTYVAEAWRFIQNLHDQWLWRQRNFTALLRANVDVYAWRDLRQANNAPAIERETGFRNWRFRQPGTPESDGVPEWYLTDAEGGATYFGQLVPISHEAMRLRRLALRVQDTRPTSFAVQPENKDIIVSGVPNAPYLLHGSYITGVQILSSDNQVPIGLEEEDQRIIKWRAVMMLHAGDEAGESYAFAAQQYGEMLGSLERNFLPQVTLGGTLA